MMTTGTDSNLCSVCNKSSARRFCIGCKKHFCPKDFKEHEQQLSIKFDNEIVRSHDELLDQIQKLEKSNSLSLDLFDQIEQWKNITINKVKKAAEKAQHELTELIDKQRITIIKQLELITREIRYRREEENFVENDIDELGQKLNDIKQKLEQFTQKDATKTIIVNNDQIDWNRLIYIQEQQLDCEYIALKTSPIQQNPHSSDRCQSATAAKSTDDKSQSTFSKFIQYARSLYSFDIDKEKLRPCRDSINCLQQTLNDHCKRYSHPCRFSELCRNQDKEPHLTHEPHPVEKCLHDKFCKRLDDPFHRATYRHTDLPDFLIPCRDQRACQIRSTEHRIKYSHGENVERISTVATIDKPRMPSQASSVSSESYGEKQHNRHENRDEQIPCRYGSKCRDQTNSRHCSRYSHPSEPGLKSSFDQDRSRIPCPFGSACYNTSDADHCSKYSHSSVQRHQPEAIGNHQRTQCPFGIQCRNTDALHLSKYSHSFK